MYKRQQGFLIVEVLLSMVILSMVFLSLFTTLSFLTNRTQRSTYDSNAATLMQEGMEETRSALLAKWTTTPGNYHPEINSVTQKWHLTAGDEEMLQGKFTRIITISNVCRDANDSGNQIACPGGQIDQQSKKITVKISWKEASKDKSSEATLLVYKQK